MTLVSMFKDAQPLRMLFGKNRNIELTTKNAYHHAGVEYRLDNHKLIEEARKPDETLLHHWLEHVKGKLEGWVIKYISGTEHGDEALYLGSYHDLQAVLCELDSGSGSPSRGMQGPIQVKDRNNKRPGAASN